MLPLTAAMFGVPAHAPIGKFTDVSYAAGAPGKADCSDEF
jgi:hypothetical protein